MIVTVPRVTIIIATYNWSSVLRYAIASALGQTFRDFELLVVGDGCTDDSQAVATASGDPRVRWINLPQNTGHQSGPNNEGLRQARGEIIAYLGHDDLWLPHHLALAVAQIDRGAGMTYGLAAMVATGDEPVTFEPSEMGHYEDGLWIPPTVVTHRKSLVEKAGGWKNFVDVNQDPEADLWQRLRQAGADIRFIPRLVAIKFPAIWRKNAYKEKKCDEQAAWFERITSEPDLEAIELAKMLTPVFPDLKSREPIKLLAREFFSQINARLQRRLKRFGLNRTMDRQTFLKKRRRFKGLDS